jgi:hypothetical protein
MATPLSFIRERMEEACQLGGLSFHFRYCQIAIHH